MDEPPPADEDVDVADERARVSAQMGADGGRVSDVILLDRLRRVYKGGKVAVRNLSFGVPLGQVFGFLGINGAGKSSALKMLTGDILPTSGTARLAGYDIITEQPEVRRLLGYCPQFDALLDLLTVREHLELYARIKGVPEKEVTSVVETKLTEMDLRQFANKKAGTLSGGNKRKLSVAIALIGDPPIVFLDEPSTGMDPVARRFMWSVISRVATERKQCSIILTTHRCVRVRGLETCAREFVPILTALTDSHHPSFPPSPFPLSRVCAAWRRSRRSARASASWSGAASAASARPSTSRTATARAT
jgi:ATP-binding cassette subfamily A (ABC1) protein 1